MRQGAAQYHMVEYQPRSSGRAVGEVKHAAINVDPREWLRNQTLGTVTLLASWRISHMHYLICKQSEMTEAAHEFY